MSAVSSGPVAAARRPTLLFLDAARVAAPVFLDTDVDMSAVVEHRRAAAARGARVSVVSCVLHATARVLAAHPEANAALRGRRRPRVARYAHADAKLTLDAVVEGHRVVLSAVLPALEDAGLAQIQDEVRRLGDADPEHAPEFAGARTLRRLPWPLGTIAYRLAVVPLRRRHHRMGTFAVTSLGHRAVDGFASVGGTTTTFGVGRIVERPVVRDGSVVVAPVMRLTLAFDHRVIDGAEAADVLTEVTERLEHFAEPGGDDDERRRGAEALHGGPRAGAGARSGAVPADPGGGPPRR